MDPTWYAVFRPVTTSAAIAAMVWASFAGATTAGYVMLADTFVMTSRSFPGFFCDFWSCIFPHQVWWVSNDSIVS